MSHQMAHGAVLVPRDSPGGVPTGMDAAGGFWNVPAPARRLGLLPMSRQWFVMLLESSVMFRIAATGVFIPPTEPRSGITHSNATADTTTLLREGQTNLTARASS